MSASFVKFVCPEPSKYRQPQHVYDSARPTSSPGGTWHSRGGPSRYRQPNSATESTTRLEIMPIVEKAAKLTDLDVFAFRLCPAIPGSQSGAAAQAQQRPYDIWKCLKSSRTFPTGLLP